MMRTLPPWKNVDAWRDDGITFSPTLSQEGAKIYDAILYQIMHFCEIPDLGVSDAMRKLTEVSPDSVVNDILKLYFGFGIGKTTNRNPDLAAAVNDITVKYKDIQLTDFESRHLQACLEDSKGHYANAMAIWEDILAIYPKDPLAITHCWMYGLNTGHTWRTFNALARTVSSFKKGHPYYSAVAGRYAFSLEETNQFDEALSLATKAIEADPYDSWAIHTVSHVNESLGKPKEGIQFLEGNRSFWEDNGFSCHNYWHEGLFHADLGNWQESINIWENECLPRAHKKSAYVSYSDVASLLWRFELQSGCISNTSPLHKIDYKTHWVNLAELGLSYFPPSQHTSIFYDSFVLLSLAKAAAGGSSKMQEELQVYMKDINDLVINYKDKEDLVKTYSTFGVTLIKCIEEFAINQNYRFIVDTLYPLRYELQYIGGSLAQRDMYNLLLCHALAFAGEKEDLSRLNSLLLEREAMKKGGCGYSKRIADFVASKHHD